MLLNSVHESMLDGLGQLAIIFGFSKVMGQMYGAMLMSDRPLCLDDMVEQLDISKANAQHEYAHARKYGHGAAGLGARE